MIYPSVPFFNRIRCENIIVQTRLLPFLVICWLPFLIFLGIGYYNFGYDFFSLSFLLDGRELLFNPVASIFIIVAMFIICLFSSIDLILSKPCFLGISDSDLIYLGRKRIPLVDIDIDQITSVGRFKNIVVIPRFGNEKEVHIPLLKTDCSKHQAIDLIKAEIVKAVKRLTPPKP